jgi:hypothetical protein
MSICYNEAMANVVDRQNERALRRYWFQSWAVATTLIAEAITLYLRFACHQTAAEFNKTAPLLLQIHHMFWSVPFLVVVPICWRRPKVSGALAGIAIGLIASDLLHHFLILPLTVGNTGWHWP